MYRLPNATRRITLVNLRLAFPERSEQEIQALARSSLRQTGRTAMELGFVWYASIDRIMARIRRVEGESLMRDMLARGQGLIVLTPHLGSWELYGLWISCHAPITCLYRPPRLRAFEKTLIRARGRAGTRLAPTTPRGIMELMKTLKAGEIAGILPDQQPNRENGVFAPFFGQPALTMTLVGRLASRTGAPVICGYARRLPRGRGFDIIFRHVEDGVDSDDPQTAATALNRTVERCILDEIDQYQWGYKRFRRRPEGDDTNPYREL